MRGGRELATLIVNSYMILLIKIRAYSHNWNYLAYIDAYALSIYITLLINALQAFMAAIGQLLIKINRNPADGLLLLRHLFTDSGWIAHGEFIGRDFPPGGGSRLPAARKLYSPSSKLPLTTAPIPMVDPFPATPGPCTIAA